MEPAVQRLYEAVGRGRLSLDANPTTSMRARGRALDQPSARRRCATRPVSERSRQKATVMTIIGGTIWSLSCPYASQARVLTEKWCKSREQLALVKSVHKPLAGLPASTPAALT
jgi:hypothetical protein